MATSSQNAASTNWAQVNGLQREFNNEKRVKVIKDEDGTRVAVLDKNGLRTTEPGAGIDVMTATDDQVTFDSRRNTFRILSTDVTSVTKPAGSTYGSVGVLHGQTFRPAVEAYIEFGDTSYAIPYSHAVATGADAGLVDESWYVSVTDDEVIFEYVTPENSSYYALERTREIRYYIKQQTSAP